MPASSLVSGLPASRADGTVLHSGGGVLVLELHHGTLFGLAIGWILTSCCTAFIPMSVSHEWLALRGLLLWRTGAFLGVLHARDALIQLGRICHFRHADLGRCLARRLPEFERAHCTGRR